MNMKRFLPLFAILLELLAKTLSAQSPPSPPPVLGNVDNRFLFIVDTSAAMSRHSEAIRQVVYDLVATGMNGQMRKGDSFAVWTYNEQNFPGVFPLQNWNPYERTMMGGRLAYFFKKHRYEKKAHPEVVIPDLAAVIESARDLTIYWISDGYTELKGTPFDDLINAACFYKLRSAKRDQQPLVTTLFAQDGKLVSWAVTLAGEPTAIPHNPPKPMLAVKPLPVAKTNDVAALTTKVEKAEPVKKPTLPRNPPPTTVPEKPTELAKPVPATQPPKPAAPEVIPVSVKPVVPEVKPLAAPEIAKAPSPVVPAVPIKTEVEVPPAKIEPAPKAIEASRTEAELPKPIPSPPPVQVAREEPKPAPITPTPTTRPETKGARIPRAGQTALASASQGSFSSGFYLLAGLGFLVVGGWLFYLHRQARASVQPSIISDSLSRKRK